jgi:hypothetical protein
MSAAMERWGQYLEDGGFVMLPLVVAAVVLWFALGYRWMTLRRGRVQAPVEYKKQTRAPQLSLYK